MIDVGPVGAAGGWCAPAEVDYDPPGLPVTWLVTPAELAAMTDADRAWLDEQWSLTEPVRP